MEIAVDPPVNADRVPLPRRRSKPFAANNLRMGARASPCLAAASIDRCAEKCDAQLSAARDPLPIQRLRQVDAWQLAADGFDVFLSRAGVEDHDPLLGLNPAATEQFL